ncbi:MAG: cupin domain-containing protein [Phycisphaerae bacterium]
MQPLSQATIISRDHAPVRYLLGIEIRCLVAADQTQNTFSLFHVAVPPGAFVPLHTHAPAEAFHVLDGQFEFARALNPADRPECLPTPPGATIFIPPNAIHSFKNIGAAPGHMLVICDARLQSFFDDAATSASTPPGPPPPAEIERVLRVMTSHHQALLGPHPQPATQA